MSKKRTRKDRYSAGNRRASIENNNKQGNSNRYQRPSKNVQGLDDQRDMFSYGERINYGFDIKINDVTGGTRTVNSKNIERRNNYFNLDDIKSANFLDIREENSDKVYNSNSVKVKESDRNNTRTDVNLEGNVQKREIDSLENAYVNVDSDDEQYSRHKNANFNKVVQTQSESNKDVQKEDIQKEAKDYSFDFVSEENKDANKVVDEGNNKSFEDNAIKDNVSKDIKNNNPVISRENNKNENKLSAALKEKLDEEMKRLMDEDDIASEHPTSNADMGLKDYPSSSVDSKEKHSETKNINDNLDDDKKESVEDNESIGSMFDELKDLGEDNKTQNKLYDDMPVETDLDSEFMSSNDKDLASDFVSDNRINGNVLAKNEDDKSDVNSNKSIENDVSSIKAINEENKESNENKKDKRDIFKEADNMALYDVEGQKTNKKDKKSKKYKRVKRMFIIETCLACLLFASVYVTRHLVKINTVLNNKLDEKNIGLEQTVRKEGYKTIALYGIDADDEGTTRSDTIIVANINQTSGEVKLVAVYRDTYLYVPGWKDIGGEEFTKINAAYVVGSNDQQKVENAVKALNQNLALHITDYMAVDFSALAQIVDAIGGVEVDIPKTKNFTVYMNKFGGDAARAAKAKYEKVDESILGKRVRLNGYQALGFCRVRKATKSLAWKYPLEGESDYSRSERQREVINEIVNEIKKTGISKVEKILKVFENKKNIITSFSWKDLLDLATEGIKYDYHIVKKSYSFPTETHTVRIPGGENGKCVEFSNLELEEEVRKLHEYLYPDRELTEKELENVKTISERLENFKECYDPNYYAAKAENERRKKEEEEKKESSKKKEKKEKEKKDKKDKDKKDEDKKDKDNND